MYYHHNPACKPMVMEKLKLDSINNNEVIAILEANVEKSIRGKPNLLIKRRI